MTLMLQNAWRTPGLALLFATFLSACGGSQSSSTSPAQTSDLVPVSNTVTVPTTTTTTTTAPTTGAATTTPTTTTAPTTGAATTTPTTTPVTTASPITGAATTITAPTTSAITPSANGTMIPSAPQIVDAAGNVWILSSGVAYVNAKPAGYSAGVVLLLYYGGTVYQENSSCLWWSWNGTTWIAVANPAASITPACGSGTMIPSATQIVDATGNVWTVGNGVVYVNSKAAGYTAGVVLLLYYGGTVYQENSSCLWWSWNGTTWIATANPAAGITPACPATSAPVAGTGKATTAPAGAARWAVDMVMEEPLVPFASWANAKTVYGAVGDGVADDTAALQRALNDLGTAGKAQVLYLPAGNYKITATLNWTGLPSSASQNGWGGLGIIGADPATTTITWAGPAGQAMLIQNGGLGYRYNRITWEGSGTAGFGVAHWWNANGGGIYGGSVEHQDEVFRDMNIGIMAGRTGANYGQMDSEGQVRRVTFINDAYAGLDTGSFNALDWWVWDSHFVNCGRGVSNKYGVGDSGVTTGAGAMYVYRSLFEGSTIADVSIGNNQWFSLHDNISTSPQFIQTDPLGENPLTIIAEGNTAGSISYGDAGPLLLVDNQLQSVALTDWTSDTDVLSLGNQVTLPPAAGTQRIVSVNDAAPKTTALALPATPAVVTHAVYEVPPGANATVVQSIINQSLQSTDPQPIVHFGQGTWNLGSLNIPTNASVQLVGDGYGSIIFWGTGLTIAAPAKVTIRDMQWLQGTVNITGADAPGGRVQLVATFAGPVSATHLEQTQLSLQANPGIWTLTLNDVVNAVAMGNGVVGTLTMTNNSSFLMSDTWYEGNASTLFALANGTFTYLGGHPSPANHTSVGNYPPMADLNGFSGTASFIGAQLDLAHVTSGIGFEIDNETPQTNVYLLGNTSGSNGGTENNWFLRTGAGGEVGFNLNRETSGQYPNQGDTSAAAIINTWKQARSLNWDTAPYQVPAGSVDIRFYHMKIDQITGIVINGQ